MDMKRILQAMDGVATKPVAGANDMAKFLSVIDKNDVEILMEGNPHKVTLPVQMAMQHYQKEEVVANKPKEKLIDKFFHEVEQEQIAEQNKKRQLIKQYSQTIAERVMMKESYSTADLSKAKVMATGPGPQDNTGDGGHLSLENSETQMHPTKRYRMLRRLSKRTGYGLSDLELLSDDELHQLYKEHGLTEAPIAMDPAEPNNPLIHGHQQANPATLKDRIMRTRAQLKELAELAESNDLLAWEQICQKAKGGMFMGLEQNLEQIRHGISELAKKRKQGGVASRGIDKNIGE
jgi:phosphopantetheinyl transferase (holo-ACP synthase)